jgi:hypothetical protein
MQELVGAGNTGRSNKMLSDWDPLAN